MTYGKARRMIDMTHSVAMLSRYGSSYRFGSIITFGKRVISVGVNSRKTSPIGTGPNLAIHAEIHAISVAESRVGDIKGGTISIARAGPGGEMLPSFPCPGCLSRIIDKGIRRIVYTGHDLDAKYVDARDL